MGSVSELVEQDVVNDNDDKRVIIHVYYLPNGCTQAQIGDITVCGKIKKDSLHRIDVPEHLQVKCIVCADLAQGSWY